MIDLYYWTSPNAQKVLLFLEETNTPYRIVPIRVGQGDQFTPDFIAVSPNSKIPAIVDHAPADGGPPQAVFESGAILLYLAEKYGRFLSAEARTRLDTLQWLFWQMAGLGPMLGQATHFRIYAPVELDYPRMRYETEAARLAGVLDRRLKGREFITGDYSIADMACYPWFVSIQRRAIIDLAPFPDLLRWIAGIAARPATDRAYARIAEVLGGPQPRGKGDLTIEERRTLFGAFAV